MFLFLLTIELASMLSTMCILFILGFSQISFPKIFQIMKIFLIYWNQLPDSLLPGSPIIERMSVSPIFPIKLSPLSGLPYSVCECVCVCVALSNEDIRKMYSVDTLWTQNTLVFNHRLSLQHIIISETYADMTFII